MTHCVADLTRHVARMTTAHPSSPVDLLQSRPPDQLVRFRRSLLATLSSLAVILVVVSMHAAGMLDIAAMQLSISLVAGTIALVFTLLLSGVNKRFRDPSLTIGQTLLASIVLIVTAYMATAQGHAVALLMVPIAFVYASFRFGFLTLLGLGAVVLLFAAAELLARQWFDPPHPIDTRDALVHFWALAASLMTLALIGGQHTELRRRNRTERAVSHIAMNGLSEAVLTVDRYCAVRFMNGAARELFGYTREIEAWPALDRICRFVDQAPLSHTLSLLGRQLEAGVRQAAVVDGQPGDARDSGQIGGMIELDTGAYRDIRLSASPMMTETGRIEGFVLVVRDVSETRRLMRELEHAATHDSLTGLLNRRGFIIRLKHLLNTPCGDDPPGVILAIDLDQFKMVNDACGHEAGDDLLCQAASVMASLTPPGASLARIGGDEFGLLVRGQTLATVEALANRFILAMADIRFGRDGRLFRIGASIGLAEITGDCFSSESLLSRADAACFIAKQRGRNCAQVYAPSDQEIARHQIDMGWGRRIADALQNQGFALYLQRIVPINSSRTEVDQYEVLVRMIEPDGEVIKPGAFLPAAERFNQIGAIDRAVIRMAVSALAQLAASGRRLPHLSINLSPTSLRDPTLLEWLGTTLREFDIAGANLTFELTETAAIFDLDQALNFFGKLRVMGCRVALDDVGSGFNSFANLRWLPVDQIKIDGGYVRGAISNPLDRVLVESIQRIADILGVETVAEYIESDELIELMTSIRIDHLQGNALHEPEPLESVVTRIPPGLALVERRAG